MLFPFDLPDHCLLSIWIHFFNAKGWFHHYFCNSRQFLMSINNKPQVADLLGMRSQYSIPFSVSAEHNGQSKRNLPCVQGTLQ
jgi:hypothetical protein